MSVPVLWQFAYSHFSEVARWAFDYKAVVHRRRSLLPGLHVPRMVRMTGHRQVPAAEIDGDWILGSSAIVRALEEREPRPPLYPAGPADRERALGLAEQLGERLGPHIRRAWFAEMLAHWRYSARALAGDVRPAARRAYTLAFPGLRLAMKLDMGINAAGTAESWSRTLEMLDEIAGWLGRGDHLVGGVFSVADLTAAALLSPLLPTEVCPLARDLPLPAELAAIRERVSRHRTIGWAAEIYAAYRGVSAAI